MWYPSILGFGRSARRPARRSQAAAKPRRALRLNLEQLEDRNLPSSYTAATVSDLIADINATNKAGGVNTITLTAPTTAPYVLTVVNNSTDGPTGLPVISNNDALTLVGNGDTIERSTASGTPDFRLLDVAKGGSLTLENLTLQNGLAFGSKTASEGGAIFNQGTLVLSGVTVQNNIAQGSNGVIKENGDGTPGNAAAGGGIWSNGFLTLQNGTLVLNNQAIGGTGGNSGQLRHSPGVGGDASAGGLYVAGGTANLTGVSINNNSAVGGQGIYGGQFTAGSHGGNAFGGALYVAGGSVSLSSSTVETNSAAVGLSNMNNCCVPTNLGGGLYVEGGTVTLCSDTVEYNSATIPSNLSPAPAFGGGIYIASGATVYIDQFTVANTINNTAAVDPNIDGTYILRNC